MAAYIEVVEFTGGPVCLDFRWNILPPTLATVNNSFRVCRLAAAGKHRNLV